MAAEDAPTSAEAAASEVLVSGGSAGGLAAYRHTMEFWVLAV